MKPVGSWTWWETVATAEVPGNLGGRLGNGPHARGGWKGCSASGSHVSGIYAGSWGEGSVARGQELE